MTAQFESDMKQFAQLPEDVRFYSPVLGQLAATIKTKDKLIADKDKEIQAAGGGLMPGAKRRWTSGSPSLRRR